jgi:hypothetical protein
MSDFLFRMFSLDTNALTLVILICGWGFLIMRAMLQNSLLAVASFPLLVLSALASHALLFDTNLVLGLDRGAGLALTTGIGMIVALAVIVALARFAIFLNDATGRQPLLLRQQHEQQQKQA